MKTSAPNHTQLLRCNSTQAFRLPESFAISLGSDQLTIARFELQSSASQYEEGSSGVIHVPARLTGVERGNRRGIAVGLEGRGVLKPSASCSIIKTVNLLKRPIPHLSCFLPKIFFGRVLLQGCNCPSYCLCQSPLSRSVVARYTGMSQSVKAHILTESQMKLEGLATELPRSNK